MNLEPISNVYNPNKKKNQRNALQQFEKKKKRNTAA